MPIPTDLVIDAWSPLSHKAPVGSNARDARAVTNLAPTWVPQSERRRLAAYLVLAAYRGNSARHFLDKATPQQVAEHREYGDPALVGDRIVSGVLGETWEIIVPGADDDHGDGPPLPDAPVAPADGAPEALTRLHTALLARYEQAVTDAVDQWLADTESQPGLRARQDALRTWADRVLLPALMVEAEGDCVHLGDTVYVLWPQSGGWPDVEVYDPGHYFPVLDDQGRGFPDKVHLAWQYETTDPAGRVEKWVRRLTWELVDLTLERMARDPRTNMLTGDWTRGEDGQPLLAVGEVIDADGIVRRTHPWQLDPDGQPLTDTRLDPRDPTGNTTIEVPRTSTTTCVFSDGTWPLREMGRGVDDFDDTRATWAARRRDLGCDFIPVIHVPNTPASRDHYGQSALAVVAQLADELAQADTDEAFAGRLAAGPVIALGNARTEGGHLEVQPGAVFELGEGGRMDVLDLSAGLDKLMSRGDRLLDRFFTNVKVPAALAGRVTAADAPSGISMLIDAGPFTQLIGVLRMARDPKYRLVLKMAQRLAQLEGQLPTGETIEARMAFGSYLPMDRGQVVTETTTLLSAGAISTVTAVRLLVAAGFPVEDATEEVERIRREDTAGAKDVADATSSEQLAADWLGLELPDTAAVGPPDINLPGAAGGGAGA